MSNEQLAEILPKYAALFYYQSKEPKEKGVTFESLPEEKQKPFLELAATALTNLDKLNLRLAPKELKNQDQIEALLKDRVEAEVRDFFEHIKIWRKEAIPQQELVAKIWKVWKNL